ncbi:MAG TPA: hypothetical protein VE733_07820 [Streptosporangiaceae bacterium]|nr:hypothetical protein [Streptosporangiaceae bacterium]
MTRSWRAAAALAVAILAAGCGSVSSRTEAGNSSAPVPLSLTTAETGPGATWAAVPMGAASGPNLFWQLFLLPAGGTRWSLQTPPDIATNGALILAGQAGQGLITGERPSLYLSFSAIITTHDGGRNWATLPPTSGLADVPDALAAAPDGHLIALGQDQQVSIAGSAGPSGAGWTTLTSEHALAATPAGRNCALAGLTAAAYTPAGAPLLAGTCAHAGTVGVFADTSGSWRPAGPALPASLAGQRVRVLRLSRTGSSDVALLEVGSGPSASLLSAWTSDGGQHWSLSPALKLGGSHVISVSFGEGGATAIVLNGNRGETLAGPGASWRSLPTLPPGRTVTLALPAAGTADALAADGSTLTAWQLTGGPARWAKTQVIKVPIQYGSSG